MCATWTVQHCKTTANTVVLKKNSFHVQNLLALCISSEALGCPVSVYGLVNMLTAFLLKRTCRRGWFSNIFWDKTTQKISPGDMCQINVFVHNRKLLFTRKKIGFYCPSLSKIYTVGMRVFTCLRGSTASVLDKDDMSPHLHAGLVKHGCRPGQGTYYPLKAYILSKTKLSNAHQQTYLMFMWLSGEPGCLQSAYCYEVIWPTGLRESLMHWVGWFVSSYLVCFFAYRDTVGSRQGIFRFNICVTSYRLICLNLVVFEHRCFLCYLRYPIILCTWLAVGGKKEIAFWWSCCQLSTFLI